jgi:NADPH:quinone reductase-like Zn-dependent oxidoreductase
MKAIVQRAYGTPDVLALEEIPTPEAKPDEVLVRVEAAALNAGDHFTVRGHPWLVRFFVGFPRPKGHVLGWDLAGRVAEVGANVRRFRPGDEVYGSGNGTLAEFASIAENRLAARPANLTPLQAAAVPTAAITALQGLRAAADVGPGQHVLVNGAAGGVGTFAVQIAKALGAEVTGVCSTRNVELVRSLGADHVVDYTKEDFTSGPGRYDLILDNVGNRPFAACRRVLAPGGVVLPNTGHAGMGYVLAAFARSAFVRQQARPLMVTPRAEDLETLTAWIEAGQVRPVIDRTYELADTPAAVAYVGEGHARGKVVVVVEKGGAAGAEA